MENITSYLILLILNLFFQNTTSQTVRDSISSYKIVAFDTEKIPIGDINSDKRIDTAYIKIPKFLNEEDWGDCKNGTCEISIAFSCGFPTINIGNAVAATVENIGDIDNDGTSEIIVVPSWIIGCWGQIRFLTLKNNEWKEFGRAKRNICREESYLNSIKKIRGNKIKVIEEVWIDGDVVEKTKIISIK